MTFEIEVVPTEELVRKSHRLSGGDRLYRVLLELFFHALIPFLFVGGIGLILGFVLSPTWRYVAAAIIGCGIALGLWSAWIEQAMYRRKVKTSLETLRRMSCPGTRYEFTEEGVRKETELGFSFSKWLAFRKLSQVEEFWLLYRDEDRYFVFPSQVLSAEVLKFIMRKCKENGVPLQTEWSDD